MDEYLTWLLEVSHWHWFALAVILAGFEVMSMSFFLLFPAIAAVIVGIVVYADPTLDWRFQLLIFAVLSVVATMLGRGWVRRFRSSDGPMLVNVRGSTYVGRKVRLDEALEQGQGHIRLDDTWWSARALDGETIPAGSLVEIAEVDGTTMRVRAIEG